MKKALINNKLHTTRAFLSHAIHAKFWRGHGVHSPFVYDLIRHVITTRKRSAELRNAARTYRRGLRQDLTKLNIIDFGTGHDRSATVKHIARRTSISEKYGLLLARLVEHYKPARVVEIGTSLGMSTFYLSHTHTDTCVVSIEGSDDVAHAALHHLHRHGVTNAQVRVGSFDEQLPRLLDELGTVDMAFVDGNHTYDATMRYFNLLARHRGKFLILIFDDIHWSPAMTQAWRQIVADQRVMTTIDLFRIGLAIFRTGCQKEHFRLRW